MFPKLIRSRTSERAVLMLLLLWFTVATIPSTSQHSDNSQGLSSTQATATATLNIGKMNATLQISTDTLYPSLPSSAYNIGVPITVFYNDQSGYVDFLGGFAPSLLAFDTKTNLVHSIQILTPTSPGTLISESLDPKNGELYVLDGNVANYYSITTGARIFGLQASNYALLKTINLGNGTFGTAETYDSRNNNVYVGLANRTSYQDVISIIDSSTDTIIRNIPLTMSGTSPNNYPVLQAMVYNPNNDLLYIVRTLLGLANGGFPYAGPYTTGGTSDLVIVNATTGTTVGDVSLAEPAMGIAYDPANSNAYVTLQGTAGYAPAVAVIDTRSNSLSGLIPLPGSSPGAQSFVFVTFISIPRPAGITYDPQNGFLYVGTINSNSVYVINGATNSLVTTIQTPPADYNPMSIAYDPVNGILYDSAETGVAVTINPTTNQISGTYDVQGFPADALYDCLNGNIYVNSIVQGSVYVMSSTTDKVVATIWPGDPYYKLPIAYGSSMALDQNNGNIYITNPDMSRVSIIDGATNQITNKIVFPSDANNTAVPDGIVYDSSNGNVYAYAGGASPPSVLVINTATNNLVGAIGMASNSIAGIAYDPVNQLIYTNPGGYLQAIDGNTNKVVGTLIADGFGFQGAGIGVDPKSGTLYAPDTSFGFVSILTTSPLIPLVVSPVSILNLQGNPQSIFQTGSMVTVSAQVQSSSDSTTQFIGVVQITNPKGQSVFSGTRTMSLTSGASEFLNFAFTIPLGLTPGVYTVYVSAWNGFPAIMGANWKTLAVTQTTSFTISA